jgi:hypothetical protein
MLSNFSTATTTTNYTQLRDTDSRGKFKRPTSPIWIPILPSDSSQDMSVLKRSIDAELAKAEPPSHVIASRHLDQEILARKEISDAARIKLPKSQDYPGKADWEFWQAYLAVDSLPELT